MVRAAAAQGGIYGNSVQEALYVIYAVDAQEAPLDGRRARYTLTLTPETLPPVEAFWSLTMYDRPKQFLVDNPVDRYLINSPMLASLQKSADGKIVLYLQHESPGAALESNWLPAPSEILLCGHEALSAHGVSVGRALEAARDPGRSAINEIITIFSRVADTQKPRTPLAKSISLRARFKRDTQP
ncbi:DUF1214 domain-containing protein (plasmid) [Ensifer adhaerens]